MPIRLTCPSCGATGTLPDAAAGKTAKCPRCKATLVIPILTPPASPAHVPPPPAPEDDLEFDPTAPPDTRTRRGYNPFDEAAADTPAESEVEKAKAHGPRKYAAEQYNPFAGAPAADEPPPAEDPFDYSEPDASETPAAGTFEFDPPVPRRKRR